MVALEHFRRNGHDMTRSTWDPIDLAGVSS